MKQMKIEKSQQPKIKEKFYITTPIYYASGKPHLGHAYTSIAADVLARWNKNLDKDVYLQTGTDEHGQKVVNKAKEKSKEPQQFVDELIPQFKELLKTMNISYDYFIRTTNNKHKEFVQNMLQKSFIQGDIYKGKYKGLYCIDCEKYYKIDELIDEKICPDHKKEVTELEEENYFFALSKYQNKLLKFYEDNPEFLSPKSKAQETINRVKEGLEDISISRNKESLDWGIEFPFDDKHVTYVWFDALFNYVSGLKINKKEDFWPANVHIIGKDIMWFHNVYWPAFLMSVEMEPPKKVFAHGWWTVDGEKMGKSMGNTIDPIEVAQKYGTDEFRYFVMSIGAFGDDLDFSDKLFQEKINNELNNDFGNLVSRVHTMTIKYFDGIIPQEQELGKEAALLIKKLNIFKKFNNLMQELKFNHALDLLFGAIRNTNAYINKVEPWKEKDETKLKTIINTLNFAIKMFADYIDCFLPETASRIRTQFNFQKGNFKQFTNIKPGHQIGEKDNLFTKIRKTKQNKENNTNKQEQKQKPNQQNKDKNQIKNIIFDFDGVIHNTLDLHHNTFKKYYKDENITIDNIKDSLDRNFYESKKNQNIDMDKYMDICKDELLKLEIDSTIKRELTNLAKHNNLFIISSSSEKVLKQYFINNGTENTFNEILGYETHKSKIEKFKLIFKKHNLNKDNSVFITDTLGDILEANEIGIKTIAVSFGYHEKERLEKGNPYTIVNKFKKIRKAIKKLNNEQTQKTTNNKQKEKKTKEKEEKKQITFQDLNLKVGKIIDAKQHPNAEKLYIETIDLGEENPREIVSGLKDHYKIEELIGKTVIVAANLKPAKLRGVMSNGMILVAENKEKQIGLLETTAKIGTNLESKKGTANNQEQIIIDQFFEIKLTSDGKTIYLEENNNKHEIKAKDKNITIDKEIKGNIC